MSVEGRRHDLSAVVDLEIDTDLVTTEGILILKADIATLQLTLV